MDVIARHAILAVGLPLLLLLLSLPNISYWTS